MRIKPVNQQHISSPSLLPVPIHNDLHWSEQFRYAELMILADDGIADSCAFVAALDSLKDLPAEHVYAARFFTQLADKLCARQKFVAAEKVLWTCLNWMLGLNSVDINTAEIAERLGELFFRMKKLSQAELTFRLALSIRQKTDGEPLDIAKLMDKLAHVYQHHNEFVKAVEQLEKAVNICAPVLSPYDRELRYLEARLKRLRYFVSES